MTDSVTNTPIEGVRVLLLRVDVVHASTVTDVDGRFVLRPRLGGRYSLSLTRLDYRAVWVSEVDVSDEPVTLAIRMQPQALAINPIVVSASRAEQKALEAPASVTVLDRRSVEERPAFTPIDHLYAVSGVQVATTGLTQHEVVARGFNNVASGALLVLTDNRYVHVPSLRINVYNFIALTDDDTERIEVVRGPGSALYGPNSSNGVLHIISRSPFSDPGTAVTVSGGERGVMHAQMRHASVLGRRFALKVSAQYLRGRDWPHTDPAEVAARDTTVERAGGELRLDWRPNANATVTASFGVNQAFSNVDLTPLGAAQVQDWRYTYAQTRVRVGRFFGQVFFNASNSGDTYLLRTGEDVTDESQMLVAQVQHGALVGSRINLTYGVDLQRTIPRTEGTVTGRNEDEDTINEAGAYVQAEAQLTPAVRLVVAARGDYHNRIDNPVLSPRAALVVRPTSDHSLRFTYNRAFSTPTTNNLFLDIVGGTIETPIPIPVRLVGVPSTGFSFRRDCGGGLCMRSPYTPFAVGGPVTPLPLDATLLWPVIVQGAQAFGIDLSAVTPPTATDVPTVLKQLNIGTEQFEPASDPQDIPALKPTIDNVIEFGYRGVLGERVTIGVDAYRAWKSDFMGAERVETPSVFLDGTSLGQYLQQFIPADTAQLLALLADSFPLATVTPEEARDPFDVLVTYRNFGKVSFWGADLELGAVVTPWLALRGNYSWVSENQFETVNTEGVADTLPLNGPANRAAFALLVREDRLGLNAEVRGRWVDAFPVISGVYVGTVDSYTVVDAMMGYRLPFAPMVTVTVSALNVLDHDHIEFVGAPAIGRLLTARVRAEF